jgi:DNA-binding SARP family transcriptional activator
MFTKGPVAGAAPGDREGGARVVDDQLRFGLLGPLLVEQGVRTVQVRSRQRLILAMLLMNAGRPVSVDRLIDGVWGDSPPDGAVNALQVHVSQLRRTLAAGGAVIVTQPPGYLLRSSPDRLDLLRFEELAHRGNDLLAAGQHAQAAQALGEALALWRGPPLENLPDGPFVASARTFLDERRLGVTEDRLRLLLTLRRDREVIEVGEELLTTHPLRESVWETVILALYRSGRQADALAHYRACRELLLDELGVEPMPGLQMLEQQILNHDRMLVPAVRPTSALVIPSGRPPGGETADQTVQRAQRRDADLVLADGTVLPLPERVVLGRHPDCDVVLHDSQVSRRHAEVRLVSGRHMLLDLSSSNGTWIDDQPVLQHLLSDGDTFRVGDQVISYRTRPSSG